MHYTLLERSRARLSPTGDHSALAPTRSTGEIPTRGPRAPAKWTLWDPSRVSHCLRSRTIGRVFDSRHSPTRTPALAPSRRSSNSPLLARAFSLSYTVWRVTSVRGYRERARGVGPVVHQVDPSTLIFTLHFLFLNASLYCAFSGRGTYLTREVGAAVTASRRTWVRWIPPNRRSTLVKRRPLSVHECSFVSCCLASSIPKILALGE